MVVVGSFENASGHPSIYLLTIPSQVQKDLLGMRFLAELLGAVFPEYQYTWLFPEFEESIGLELGKKEIQQQRLKTNF